MHLMTGIKIYEAKMDRTEQRNRLFYNNSHRLQYPTHNNRTTRQKIARK